MTNIIKINCESTTFVDKHNPVNNYSKLKTISTGIVNNHSSGFHLFKSLLNFTVPKINTDKIISAYLFIYIKNMQTIDTVPESIGICGNHTNINTSNLSWDNFPEDDYTDIFHLNIPKNSSNSYVKINVTEIIKELTKYHENYNLILCPIGLKSQIIVTFSSCTSDNPPYLKIEYEKSNAANTDKEIIKDKIPSMSRFVDDSTMNHNKANAAENIVKVNNSSNSTQYSLNNLNQHTNGKQYDYKKIDDTLNNILNKIAIQSESISLLGKSIEDNKTKYLLEDITKSLSTQNESLSNLSDLLKDNISQTTLNDLSSKFSSQSEELSNLKQVFLDNSNSSDFENISNIINLLNDNINNQNLSIEDIKKKINDDTSINEINNVLNLINDNNLNLSTKLIDIQIILDELNKKYHQIDSLVNITDTNSQTINTLLDKVNKNHESLGKIAENNELYSDNISQIKSNTNSAFVILNQLNSAISTNESSLKDIPNIKKLITDLNESIVNQLSKLDLVKTDIISSSKDGINIISQKSDNISEEIKFSNSNINEIKSELTSILNDNNALLLSIQSSILNDKVSPDDISSIKEILAEIMDNFISFNNNINSLNTFEVSHYNDISDILNSLSTKINTLDSATKKLNSLESCVKSNLENNTIVNNKLDIFNAEIKKVNNKFDTLSNKIQVLEDGLINISKAISDISLSSNTISNDALNSAIENTNIKLSDLSKSVDNISKTISEITIEPLN